VKVPRLKISDPGLTSLKSAARPAIVMPAMFALADQVIKQPQTAIFAAFGSFAFLVLVDFGGPPRTRLTAYLSLAVAGVVLIVVGTLCSENAWLAAGAMALVGFAILFSGVINGYFTAATTAAILLFVLPVAVPAPVSAIPWRLAGFGLAAAAGICAVMLLWPPRRQATLSSDAARACLALADLADSAFSGDQEAIEARIAAARKAVEALVSRFQSVPHQPTGPTRPRAAFAGLADEQRWLLESLVAVTGPAGPELCQEENGETMAAAAAALRASGARLTGRGDVPDTSRLEQALKATVQALTRRISELPPAPDEHALDSMLGRSFRSRAISYSTQQIVSYAIIASGGSPPPVSEPNTGAPSTGPPRSGGLNTSGPKGGGATSGGSDALLAVRQFAVEHASARSVWFRNSVRGAAGLTVAVFIAQKTDLQHAFWVVLGTLSVLRSNALGTGRSIVSALAGTAAGILVGAAILIPVGGNETVLWVILPVAVLIAAYAPRVVSFAAGQAAFTVVILILFNIIQPVGWKVGLIRIEDVAIGFAVSLGVGLVFWPRGAARLLRENIAAAYSRAADYFAAAAEQLTGGDQAGDPGHAGDTAAAAVHQLDDSFRQYLAERSAKRVDPESAARIVAGAGRVLRAGRSMAALDQMAEAGGITRLDETRAGNGSPARSDPARSDPARSDPARSDPARSDPARSDPARSDPARSDPARSDPAPSDPAPSDTAPSDTTPSDTARSDTAPSDTARSDTARPSTVWSGAARCGVSIDREIQALRSWYVTLGDSIVNGTAVPRPQPPDPDGRRQLLQCVRDAIVSGEESELRGALLVLWASHHVDVLRRLESHLSQQVAAAAGKGESVNG
jgi:uncharacterized membrane protein YccC